LKNFSRNIMFRTIPTRLSFSSLQGNLNRVIQLPVQATDRLTIDPDPYIVPLEMILEENERVLFLDIEKQESRFQIYHFGQRQEQDRIPSFVPSDRVDDSIPGRVQRHRLTHLERHLKATAQQAYHLYNDSSFDVLVLMGEERVMHRWKSSFTRLSRRRLSAASMAHLMRILATGRA
jgi:hypothetical protein